MSNRLTFSLASLILIFALTFATMPAMAATGGPTVTITDAGTSATPSTRAAFLLKFTFSDPVEGFADGEATFRLYSKTAFLGNVAGTGITPVANASNPREYTATIDVSTEATAVGFQVTVPADVATGNAPPPGNNLGNQLKQQNFDLPPLVPAGSLVLSVAKASTQSAATDGDDYVLTLTYKDASNAAVAPGEAPTVAHLTFTPSYLQAAVVAGNAIAENTDTTALGDYTLSIVHPTGAPAVMIGVEPSYIKGVTAIRVPPAAAVVPAPPMVAIAVSGHDAATREFRIAVTITPQAKSDGSAGAKVVTMSGATGFVTKISAKDNDDGDVILTEKAGRGGDNSYTGILEYDRLSTLPITLSIDPNDLVSGSKPDADAVTAMVGEAAGPGPDPGPDPGAPAAPMNVMATADQAADTITVTWDAVAGATSYTVTKHYTAADGTAMTKVLPDANPADTTITIPPAGEPALDHGVAFTFTVTATNAAGTSAASAMSNSVMIDAPPANNAPVFLPGTTIADISARVGMAITSMTLPQAADVDAGDTVMYSLSPDPPAGLMFNAATRMLSGTPTAAAPEMTYTYTASDGKEGGMTTLTFKITVAANNAPAFAAGTSIANIMARETMAITAVTLPSATDADGDTITYSLTPTALPAGLMLNGMVISGTPTTAMAATQYTWTASDGIDSAYLMFNITVAADNAPTFGDQSIDNITATVGKATTHILPMASDADGDAITYSLSPNPSAAGLTFNATTQVLSGTPRAVTAPAVYTYTATAGTKSASLRFIIEVNAAPGVPQPGNNPPAFAAGQTISNISGTVGTPITSQILPVATDPDGDRVTHTLTPIPPAWLTYRTGVLSGTPTAPMSPTGYRYVASDGKGGVAVLSFVVEVAAAAPTVPTTPAIILPAGIPDIGSGFARGSGRVVGTTTLSGSIAADSFGVVLADDLPDLEDFFRQKGTIVLDDGGSAKKRSVLMSEILWGLDHGESAGMQDRRQFIELYNTSNSASVNVTGWTLTFTLGRPAPNEDVDRVSNAGTIVDAGWFMDIGQSGVLTGTTLAGVSALGGQGVPVDIISAYRNINYNATQSSQDLKDDHTRAGHKKGSWKATTRITTQVGIKASPGARHFVELGTLTASKVSRSPFIINEIGNAAGGASDWIELRNLTDSEQSLKNYLMTVVTGDKKENILFHFHDQDFKVPAKGIILVTSTDPSNNDLAGGNNVAKNNLDEVLEGASHLYVVPNKPSTGFNIPDSGKILLILRNGYNNKPGDFLTKDKNFVDVVGTLSIQDAGRGTALWPLSVTGGPDGNTIDGTGEEDFRAGKVYQRHGDVHSGRGEKHWAVRGYTGIGYDRFAAVNGENGGTPGYSNGALKHKYSDYSGQIAISEIMLATEEDTEAGRLPRATRLPQWIELYNNSMTQAVTINSWHLEVQNDDTEGFVGNLHGTLRLKNITIQPNQTVIIVSNSGLNSGNFPAQRLINVFLDGTYRRDLGLARRGDQMLNPAGFYIELRDHENRPVDEIGNLGVSRRTGTGRRDNFGEAWEMPSLHSEEGHRTSLIRVYNNKEAENGLMMESWRRASDTSFRNVPSLTYYGNHRDFGTPGYRGGGPLPVQLSKFRPERLDTGEVVIRWVTESELNNAGFNILRTETRDGEYQQVNTELIEGRGTTSERYTYTWTDTTAKPNVVYYYQIQDVSLDGQVQTLRISRLKGNVSAEGKVTTTWGSLKLQD